VPGGLLIIETPNPENLVVAGSRFYMDPTHVKPLPPPLLSFAAEYAGFARVKVLRLQEPRSLHDPAAAVSLLNVLEDVSPDYAVLAQKGGDDAALAATAAAFEPDYGLTLPTLATRHAQHADAQVTRVAASLQASIEDADGRFARLAASVKDAENRATLAENKAVQAHKEAREIQSAVRAAIEGALKNAGTASRIAELEARAQRAEALVRQYHEQLQAVHASTSWRVTAPLRKVGMVGHALRRDSLKSNAKQLLRHAGRYVNRRPWLAKPALRVLRRFPRAKLWLARVMSGLQLHSLQRTLAIPTDAAHLTPYAQEIYSDLKTAVARRQKAGA
jgi:O-antigen chain-terminating methyltransferase